MTSPRIALRTETGAFLLEDGRFTALHSPFADNHRNRGREAAAKQAWKSGGERGAAVSPWFATGQMEDPPARVTAICGLPRDGELLYALATREVGGVFRSPWPGGNETRLAHHQGKVYADLRPHPGKPLLACSVHQGISAHLAVGGGDASRIQEVTEGDSWDGAPFWVPGEADTLLYHSSGIARDARGHFRGLGPFHLLRLDLDQGNLETVLEDPKNDLLCPALDAEGRLLHIRRPHLSPIRRDGVGMVLKDTLLFPLRVLQGILGFLNVFSALFGGKPLVSSRSARETTPRELRRLWLHGRMVDLEQDAAKVEPDEAPSVVPSSWKLVRRSTSGQEEVLAERVLCYDLAADGTIAYSDGSGVFLLRPGQEKIKLGRKPGIESVALVSPG